MPTVADGVVAPANPLDAARADLAEDPQESAAAPAPAGTTPTSALPASRTASPDAASAGQGAGEERANPLQVAADVARPGTAAVDAAAPEAPVGDRAPRGSGSAAPASPVTLTPAADPAAASPVPPRRPSNPLDAAVATPAAEPRQAPGAASSVPPRRPSNPLDAAVATPAPGGGEERPATAVSPLEVVRSQLDGGPRRTGAETGATTTAAPVPPAAASPVAAGTPAPPAVQLPVAAVAPPSDAARPAGTTIDRLVAQLEQLPRRNPMDLRRGRLTADEQRPTDLGRVASLLRGAGERSAAAPVNPLDRQRGRASRPAVAPVDGVQP